MEYAIYIIYDRDVENDYCFISSNAYDDNTINLTLYTNGKSKIDFRKLNYIAFSESQYNDFINTFSYGRNVIDNAKLISLTNSTDKEKNTKKDNRELMRVLESNKELLNKKVFIDVGAINLCEEDLDSLKPFKKCKYASVTFDETNIYHAISELEIVYELVNEVVRRTIKHDFTQLEQMLYAYDIIRTNFAGNKVYEEKMEKILKMYNEPSYCYSLLYREVLNRLKIKNVYSFGNFFFDSTRAINIVHVKDEDYNIEGIYYFDIANNSKQRVNNSLLDEKANDELYDNLINNYESFCKTKDVIEDRGSLDVDYTFGDFDRDFMLVYDHFLEKEGINGIFKLRGLLNNVSHFVDGKDIIDNFRGIKDESELEDIRSDTERYVSLFSNDIDGEDFLEMLFNVRKVEYMENKEVFPLGIEELKKCLYNSQFKLPKMYLDFEEEKAYEQEEIEDILLETFENCFEETINNQHIEEKIKSLKLSLNKDINKPNKEDNN